MRRAVTPVAALRASPADYLVRRIHQSPTNGSTSGT